MIYFDSAAATKVDPKVVQEMMPYFTEHYGNPSSIHGMGRKTRSAVEKARKKVANLIGASTGEIFFTSGGTESNNTVIKNCIHTLGVNRVISSKIEHHCVLHTCEHVAQNGIPVHYVNVDEQGFFDLNHLEKLLQTYQEDKILVSLIHAHNEIGTVNDWVAIGNLCHQYGALYHADTVQTIAHYAIDLENTPVDFASCSGHKFHGPKGIGFLYINENLNIEPFIHGGAQERNMRAGTENVSGVVGLAKALEIAYDELNEHQQHIKGIRAYFKTELETCFPNATFNGDQSDDSLYTVLNVSLPATIDNDMLLFNLDINGVCVSAGSACSSGANKGSHVINEIYKGKGKPSIRFSFSKYSTKDEVNRVIDILRQVIPS